MAPTPSPSPAVVPTASAQLELAERHVRAKAFVQDVIYFLIVYLVGALIVGLARSGGSTVPLTLDSTPLQMLAVYAVYLAVNGWPLLKTGQTRGQRAAGCRIVNRDGSPASFWKIVLPRQVFVLLPFIPEIGLGLWLLDVLAIFRSSRRCLHDDWAGTIVVTAAVAQSGKDDPDGGDDSGGGEAGGGSEGGGFEGGEGGAGG